MKKRGLAGVLACALVSTMLAGCTGKTETVSQSKPAATEKTEASSKTPVVKSGGTFIIPINRGEVASVTPYDVYGADDLQMAAAPCFDPLYIVTKNETRWYLAKSMEMTSKDGLKWQLTLNEGMKWHDGVPITADDVVYTVDMLLDPNNNGAPSTSVSYDGHNISAKKVNDLTVEITLEQPFSAFVSELGRVRLIPKHVFGGKTTIKDMSAELNKGIGSGPYKLKANNPGDSIVYERYDDYYRGAGTLDQVVIRMMPDQSAQEAALQSGEISFMRVINATKLGKYKADSNFNVVSFPEARLNYLTFNYQSSIMKNMDARKAICLALNNTDIIKGAYGSTELAVEATNFCSPENLYYNSEMKGYTQNIEEAKKLAESSGLTKKTLKYIYFQARPNMKETAQIVQQQLKEIGVNVEIEGRDASDFFIHLFAAWLTGKTIEDTTWDLATNGMDSLNSDPATKMSGWKGDLVQNGFYVSPKSNDLWNKASQAISETDREKYYKELQVSMQEDYSLYPMANTNYVMAVRAEFGGVDAVPAYPVFEDYTKIFLKK